MDARGRSGIKAFHIGQVQLNGVPVWAARSWALPCKPIEDVLILGEPQSLATYHLTLSYTHGNKSSIVMEIHA